MHEPENKTRLMTRADIVEKPPRPKPQVPDHELIRSIGSGAYGEVWLAKNVVGTYRAVKVVYRDSFKDSRPYEREYHGLKKFEPISRSNDGFVDILQIGRNDNEGCFYCVMELADAAGNESEKVGKGVSETDAVPPSHSLTDPLTHSRGLEPTTYVPKTLRSEIQSRGRLPFEECLQFALSLNLALGHLHRHGLIHRDIKPSNIIFVSGVPKLADIGLVTDVEEARSFVGTEGFIPPEGPNSPRADIYSLGKVIYEMSMGKDRTEFPEPFTALGQATDSQELEELNTVILKACASNPRDRYQSAEDMHVDLALLQSGKSVKSKHMLERRLVFARKAGAVVGVIASIAVAAYLYQQFQTREARRLAQAETFQRTRAEGLLNTLQLKEAEHFFENDDASKGVAYLARMLRQNPSNDVAAARLMSALTDRSFALPLRVFQRTQDLRAVEFSPDGQRVLTCTAGGTNDVAQIWDARTGEKVGKLMRHDGPVRAIRFSPDGRFIVTGSNDGSARLWNATTSEPVTAPLVHERGLEKEPPEIWCAEFSSDGQTFVTGYGSSKMQVWKVPTGEPLSSPLDHGAWLDRVEFSPDGQRIVSLGGGTVKIWLADTGKLERELHHEAAIVEISGSVPPYVHFSPDGSRIIATHGNRAYVWQVSNGELLHHFQHESAVTSARFSPDGLRVVTTDRNQSARVWDAQTGQLLIPPLMHKSEVRDAQFDPTGERLLTCDWQRARIWDSRTGRPLTEWLVHFEVIQSARFSPDGMGVLVTTREKNAVVWDAHPGEALNVALRHQAMVPSARFSGDGEKIVTAAGGEIFFRYQAGQSNEAVVWDGRTGEPIGPRIKSVAGVQYAEFAPDGRTMVTASHDGSAQVWDAQTLAAVAEPLRHKGHVRSARFSPDGKKVVTASDDHSAQIWDAGTGLPLIDALKHVDMVWSAEFSVNTSQRYLKLLGHLT